MGITVSIRHEASIDELIRRFACFSSLRSARLPHTPGRRWNRGGNTSYDAQVIFVGKSGYGKSSTVNAIVGQNVFETSDVEACTRTCQSAEFRLGGHESPYYLSLGDLPGIGESGERDREYLAMYREFLAKADLAVYVLRADNRDFAVDLDAFAQLFAGGDAKRVMIALNGVDKVEPLTRRSPFAPTELQMETIERKVADVSRAFGIDRAGIVPYSAAERWNLAGLAASITGRLGPFRPC